MPNLEYDERTEVATALVEAMDLIVNHMGDERARELWYLMGVPDGADVYDIAAKAATDTGVADLFALFASIVRNYGEGGLEVL